jgi:hypothetical protein
MGVEPESLSTISAVILQGQLPVAKACDLQKCLCRCKLIFFFVLTQSNLFRKWSFLNILPPFPAIDTQHHNPSAKSRLHIGWPPDAAALRITAPQVFGVIIAPYSTLPLLVCSAVLPVR